MATELARGIRWFDLGGVNAYLVDDGGDLTLVDAGMPWHARKIVLGIDAAGYSVSDVDRVLVTHYDLDHVGGLARLEGLDATIHVGAADAPLLTGERRPDPRGHKGLLQFLTSPLVGTPSCPVERVADGDRVGGFTAYHTPGHTPGHVVYVAEEPSVAFLGDLVRETDGRLEPSPWVLSYDTDQVAASVRDLAERAPEFAAAGMGHGVPFERGGSDRLAELAAELP